MARGTSAPEEILYGDHYRRGTDSALSDAPSEVVVFTTAYEGETYEHHQLQGWWDEQINFDSAEDCYGILDLLLRNGETTWLDVVYRLESEDEFREQFQLIPVPADYLYQ